MEFFRPKLGLWICAFIVLLIRVIETTVPNDILTEHNELLKNLKSYEIIKPYRIEGRKKRHASTRLLNGHVEETTLVFDGEKKRFTLDIVLNKGLFSPQYSEIHVLRDGSKVPGQKLDNCFYHGTVRGDDNATVSLSTCDGIEGVITNDEGSFYIQPLKSKGGKVLEEHLVFRDSDVAEKPVTCGQSHKIYSEFNHQKQTSNVKIRVRRDILRETKYVELFIINDVSQYKKKGNKTELRAKQLVNHMDSIYRPQKIRIALVKVETWKERDLISVDKNATITLNNFVKYKNNELDKDKGKHWDNIQLLTGIKFKGTTVGYAPIGSICGRRSAAVVQDHNERAAVTASTMAHELGHNFGMQHDLDNCECPAKQCVMNAVLSSSNPPKKFSSCSVQFLRKTLEDGYGTCLYDEPAKLFGPAICGNGFVEEGEQCDCGTQEECTFYENKCCNATTCMLHPEAACSHGECCDNCQMRPRGYLCRKKHDDCDLSEYCTGDKELCPEDTYVHNGISCKENQGYCYNGVCRELTLQCQYLFGNDVVKGNDSCFGRNARSGIFYNCYNETHGSHSCNARDVKCGKLHCLSEKTRYPIKGQDRNFVAVSLNGRQYCLVPGLTHGDGQDLRYVQDGTKCGADMMCKNSKCLPVSEVVPVSSFQNCPNNCSGNGVCNNKGHCHCYSGYACPDCVEKGPETGGSSDSGQGCQKKSGGVNVAVAVIVPLFLIFLIALAVIVYLKRRTIQERLNHYKFVRRTVARSSDRVPVSRRAREPGAPRPTVSGPTKVEVNVPEPNKQPPVRRGPPPRPTAPPAENEPTSSHPMLPEPPASSSRKPPVVLQQTRQPQTGHQSVPLFPPSAAPDLQETAKPKPTPPRSGNQYLPESTSKPLPAKPKFPPTRPFTGHSSVPDLQSANKPATPPTKPRTNVPPRPKPRAPLDGHRSVPDFPDEVPVPKPRNLGPREGHQSVPLLNLPDGSSDENAWLVKPSAVKASQAKPSPPRKPHAVKQEKPVDFRAGLKPVPKPWEKS